LPANHKVSVGWQIVATFIPVIDLWAFYRIRKLQKYLLYVIAPILLSILYANGYFGDLFYFLSRGHEPTPWGDETLVFREPWLLWVPRILGSVIWLGLEGFAIYLAIILSRA
jgi:hypothetical protein